MIGWALYVVAGETIRVSHDGRRDPRWSGTLDYASGDDWLEYLMSHCKEMDETKVQNFQLTIAEHQNDRRGVQI